jgi:2-oxoglutarate/2-oxoacid ferredoxin oxidoreductase subunit alpha
MPGTSAPARVNDFTLKLANVNGTGSASANGLLMKSFFRMGIPVSGKNYFPSNIQGLPTWYEIRISREGYRARSGQVDLMVAMNAQTYAKDLAEVRPGGYLLYDSTWPRSQVLNREDITVLGAPFAQLCNEAFDGVRTRILMKNMVYVGTLAALLDIDVAAVEQLAQDNFGKKAGLAEANMKAFRMGWDYAKANFECPLPFRVEPMQATGGMVMMDGNTTAGLGCVYAGATIGAWYPITPSTSLMDAYRSFCARFRADPKTGERRYCVIQAEDELAAIGMVLGASWAGARAFTPTSGPGISLMAEFIGYGYFTEIPAVIFDVQRVGPSTGLPTRTQQGDITLAAYASHGDTRHPVLFPADPTECFDMAVQAFDLAERLQTPVFVLSDLDIGMNDWMCKAPAWDDKYVPDRGKVLSAAELERIEKFRRYADVDGDGIPRRSLPGVHPKGAYFTRGSGHNEAAGYTEDAGEYERLMERLKRKFATAAGLVPPAVLKKAARKTSLGIISVGSCDDAVSEARDRLGAEGIHGDYLRIRAFPFGPEVQAFLDAHERIFVIEQNRDAQLRSLLINECPVDGRRLESILHYDGLPMAAAPLVDAIRTRLATGAAA